MYAGQQTTDDLILDLSLASAFPVGIEGQDLFRGAASTQALAYRTEKMDKHELRELEHTMGPLLGLLANDVHHPIAAKSAYGIRTLIPSRSCLNRYVENDGIPIMARVFDQLLSNNVDLHTLSDTRTIIENLAVVYRELARFYDVTIVRYGAIRHCVRMINYGDSVIRGTACSCLAILSNNAEIVQQMFAYGAIRPVINLCDENVATEPEILAALGCVVQLSRIPEIASKVARQGAIPLLDKMLHSFNFRTSASMRNKALLSLAWISRVPEQKANLMLEGIFSGIERELHEGSPQNQTLVLQMMINLRLVNSELKDSFNQRVRDRIIELLGSGLWFLRNLTTKTMVLIYVSLEDKLYCVERGALEHIFDLIRSKNLDLQEVPMVALLSFLVHPQIPFLLLEKKGQDCIVEVLYAANEVIRDMAVLLLKALALYDHEAISACIPLDREHLMKVDPDADPVVYGAEYGGMILNYLQLIVNNRREMRYLLEDFDKSTIEKENISPEELESFQDTFMILDYDCNGTLAMDEIKVCLIMLGEKMDEEEIELLFKEYDEDGSGELSFQEFCVMMKNWRERFGSGATKVYNEAMQRGAIGKGRRALERWLNKDELDRQAIAKIKEEKAKAEADKQAAMEKHMGAEKLRVERAKQKALREQQQAEGGLPPIN
jgi:hypothetical protein